jgi:hypothetical protein
MFVYSFSNLLKFQSVCGVLHYTHWLARNCIHGLHFIDCSWWQTPFNEVSFKMFVEYTTMFRGWPGFAPMVSILLTAISGMHHLMKQFLKNFEFLMTSHCG